ncbi:MAG: hypothetical protein LUG60_04145 [Erysipelotrichaceae bacterium]|nr:hypothetical protein [Erysipelotrichaceae bacterium]
MKKIIAILLSTMFMLLSISTPVMAKDFGVTIEYLDNGMIVETQITESNYYSTTTKTGSKVRKYKDSDGNVLFTVKVSGTFKYDGSTCTCTKSSVTTSVVNSNWKITDSSASKSGSTATATATAKRYMLGVVVETQSVTIKLKCSASGSLS